MFAIPRMIQVRGLAQARLVEGSNCPWRERVGIPGGWLGLVCRLALGIELAQVGVSRAVLLHEHDDVINVVDTTCADGRHGQSAQTHSRRHRCDREHQGLLDGSHFDSPDPDATTVSKRDNLANSR